MALAGGQPLAQAPEPLADALVQRYRAVAVADSAQRANITLGVEQLSTAEPDLAPVIADGAVTIAGAYYDLASGEVAFL